MQPSQRADAGWRLLKYESYRDLQRAEDVREKAAERQRRKRERDAAKGAEIEQTNVA